MDTKKMEKKAQEVALKAFDNLKYQSPSKVEPKGRKEKDKNKD